ncbi:MAG: hypothetical protein ACOCQ4_01135, partial [bacterium]
NTYFPNLIINLVALVVIAFYTYNKTLKKKDLFTFLMVVYFMSAFPFLNVKGGGVNLIIFVAVLIYFLLNQKSPFLGRQDKITNTFLVLWILSSILGWFSNYAGTGINIIYSAATFFGVIFVLLSARSIILTPTRIAVFIKLNLIIISYAIIAFINARLGILDVTTFLLPQSRVADYLYVEASGIIGSSPVYGEFSLIMLALFFVFYLFNPPEIRVSKRTFFVGALLAAASVVASISRSVFLLAFAGVVAIIFFQFLLYPARAKKAFGQFVLVFLFFASIYAVINFTGISYVFQRLESYEKSTIDQGGISWETIKDGSAYNRSTAFAVANQKYHSRDNWLIGYGWGLPEDNRHAFYTDVNIARGSAHTQLYAILFLFGWIGTIGYWGLLFRIIYLSYNKIKEKKLHSANSVFAFFSMFGFGLMMVNEIKVDNVSTPNYFTMTMILLGLSYANIKYYKKLRR